MTSVSPRSRRDSGNKSSSSHASQKKDSILSKHASHRCRQYNLPHKLRIGDGTCLGTLRQETPQRTYYNRQFFCSGLPRLHEIQSMDLLGGYPAQILPFFDGQLWTAPI